MNDFRLDLRYAMRGLARSPLFAIVAVLTLGLGIGVNTAVFGAINGVLLRKPAGIERPDRLVHVFTSDFSGPAYGASSYPDYEDFAALDDVFEGVALYSPDMAALGETAEISRTGIELVSASYFDVLGVTMAAGRSFEAADAVPGAPATVVIGYGLWRGRFGADPSIVGSTVRVNGRPATVIGIAPDGFTGRMPVLVVDVWTPFTNAAALGFSSQAADVTQRGSRGALVMARLRPDVTPARAQERLEALALAQAERYPDEWMDVTGAGRRITLLPESEGRIPPIIRTPVLAFGALLLGIVVVVLLICCANLAGLLVARAARRSREMAIRLSLGASRARLVRQLLTEALVLAACGAALAALLAMWGADLIQAVIASLPVPVPLRLDQSADLRVFGFATAVTLLSTVLFALAPALRASRPDIADVLKAAGGGGATRARGFTLRKALLTGQIAASVLLLVGALLFLRTLGSVSRVDLGFESSEMLLVNVESLPGTSPDAEQARSLALTLRDRLSALPNVASVSWASFAPLTSAARLGTTIEGYVPAAGEDMELQYNVVGPDYFETIGLPLVRGRGFTEADRAGAEGIAIVNETFADRFWPGQDPLTHRIGVNGPEGPMLRVVGVARNARYGSLTEDGRPYYYLPALQQRGGLVLHVRTDGDPQPIAALADRATRDQLPRGWSVLSTRTVSDHVALAPTGLLATRIAAGMLSAFGALALLLAGLGLYGVVAYAVAARTREIGVRVALGARATDVRALVLRELAGVVSIGLVVGLALAAAAAPLLGTLLLGVSPFDPVAFCAAAAILAMLALLAGWLPARRAARLNPMLALRLE